MSDDIKYDPDYERGYRDGFYGRRLAGVTEAYHEGFQAARDLVSTLEDNGFKRTGADEFSIKL